MSVSFAVNVVAGSGIYGNGCRESAAKKRTSLPSSFSEKLKVGIRTWRYDRTAVAIGIGLAQRGIGEEVQQPLGVDPLRFR